jgi:RNA polymerase sigma factor (sigma-70 family)
VNTAVIPAFDPVRTAVEALARLPGDVQARESLCRAIYPFITPIVLTKTRRTQLPAEEIEDIVQEALLALYQHVILCVETGDLSGPVGEMDFRRVIYRTADAVAARERRRRIRARRLSPASLRTDENVLETVVRSDMISNVIAQLGSNERRLIDLWSRGCTHRETAGELRMTENSVRQAVSRILQRLRTCVCEPGFNRT